MLCVEFFCDNDSLDKASEVLLFMVPHGPGRASLQVRQGPAATQCTCSFWAGYSEDLACLEDTSAYKEWHLIYTVVETICKFFSS